jgi:hypothetical protein
MFTASIKKYDPDVEDDTTFDTWQDAGNWLIDQQKYFGCSPSMRINGDRVRIHKGHAVNDEMGITTPTRDMLEAVLFDVAHAGARVAAFHPPRRPGVARRLTRPH